MTNKWSKWRRFADPRRLELLTAPFGPGCYVLRDGEQLVLYGMGGHLTQRMVSLLPSPFGPVDETTRASGNMFLTISTALNIEPSPVPRVKRPKNASAS